MGTTTGQNPKTKTKYNLIFFNEWESTKDALRKTFRTGNSKGKQKIKSTLNGASFSPYNYQFVTDDDLHNFSISYLKDKQIKCPECESRTNLIEHGLNICHECGLILKAPSCHPGYVVDDTLPKWKVAPTLQDINQTKNQKEAHHLAYTHYWEQVGIIDPTTIDEIEHLKQVQEDWISAWKYYKKVIVKRGKTCQSKTNNSI